MSNEVSQQSPPPGYYQQGQPPKKKHTVRNVFLVLTALFILVVGGCLAMVGGAVNEVDKAMKAEEANDKPVDVEEGEAFTHDDYEADAGWSVARDGTGTATIKGLKVTNSADSARAAQLTFRFYKGNENLAEVECTANQMESGEKSGMQCFSLDEKFPRGYDAIRVSDMW
jgi:hypothetical protein